MDYENIKESIFTTQFFLKQIIVYFHKRQAHN